MIEQKAKQIAYNWLLRFAALYLVGIVVVIFLSLLSGSFAAIHDIGLFNFITGSEWNPARGIYGAWRPLAGTVLTTALALFFAVPLSLGTALYMSEFCPAGLKNITGIIIEYSAQIPGFIYGMWGLTFLLPFMDKYVQPRLGLTLGKLPGIGHFFTDFGGGHGLLAASLILALMILPLIASLAYVAFISTPRTLKESAYGVGATKWEVIRDVILPHSKRGVAAGVMIATARALGDTVAVFYLLGGAFTTTTGLIATEFAQAEGLHLSALCLLALILFMFNFIVLSFSKYALAWGK